MDQKSEQPAIRVIMMPRDTNHQGNIFGGTILAYIDQAGFVEAKKQAYHTYVTVSIDRVEFLKPINVGGSALSHRRAGHNSKTHVCCPR